MVKRPAYCCTKRRYARPEMILIIVETLFSKVAAFKLNKKAIKSHFAPCNFHGQEVFAFDWGFATPSHVVRIVDVVGQLVPYGSELWEGEVRHLMYSVVSAFLDKAIDDKTIALPFFVAIRQVRYSVVL